jgi:hypothetical protein
MNVVLDSHSAHFPILIQHSLVDILAQFRIFQIRLDNEPAEVNARFNRDDTSRGQLSSSMLLAHVCEDIKMCHGNIPYSQVSEHAVLVFIIRISPSVMRVHTEVMPKPMRKESDADPFVE